MIRIRRGPEPATLPPVRRIKLTVAAKHYRAGPLTRDHVSGYNVVKSDLCEVQHHKCCYCERNNFEAAHSDVEHFRPAIKAEKGSSFHTQGYWWLAWTWKNLMFSCKICNGSAKGAQFPLDPTSTPLLLRRQPPGGEIPLLIDPCSEDPMEHVQFVPRTLLGRPKWFPVPRAGSVKGDTTIKVLKLDRPGLLTLYENHVSREIEPVVEDVRRAMSGGDQATVSKLWERRVEHHALAAWRPFTALSYDALDHFIPPSDRKAWSLTLLKP